MSLLFDAYTIWAEAFTLLENLYQTMPFALIGFGLVKARHRRYVPAQLITHASLRWCPVMDVRRSGVGPEGADLTLAAAQPEKETACDGAYL